VRGARRRAYPPGMVRSGKPRADHAVRGTVRGEIGDGAGLRRDAVGRAEQLGVLGWVRSADEGELLIHAEGSEEAVAALVEFLRAGPAGRRVTAVEVEPVKPEGHEQFAVRGVSAGRFEIVEGGAGADGRFELRLEVDGTVRAWVLPKGPSMDPASKRMAFESAADPERGDGVVWDEGSYEQGGRVRWPEAIERGHAVFVLHGAKLRGGFALQRIRAGSRPGWLLIKRRDEHARRGPDVVAED
jgi:acylphosphatase